MNEQMPKRCPCCGQWMPPPPTNESHYDKMIREHAVDDASRKLGVWNRRESAIELAQRISKG